MSDSKAEGVVNQPQTPASAKPAETAKPTDYKLPDSTDIDATYRGKSVNDIIEMHKNATRRLGEQGNEIGTWRSLVNELSEHVRRDAKPAKTEIPKISTEDMLKDPTLAVSRIVDAKISDAVDPMRKSQELTERNLEVANLERDFPGYRNLGETQEFQGWAFQTAGRSRDARAASQGDLAAARRLLEQWQDREALVKELKGAATAATASDKPQGLEGARKAQIETGGQGGAAPGSFMNGHDIVKMIINNPDKYRSESFQKELREAAKAGRIKL